MWLRHGYLRIQRKYNYKKVIYIKKNLTEMYHPSFLHPKIIL